MIFVDSNIPMYLIGAAHPHKPQAQELLERAIAAQERLVTDVDEVFAIDLLDVQRARDILLETKGLSARDSLHLAVMERHGVQRIMSFDTGFDDVPGIARLKATGKPP
jgi:predicted nucleic acid-binding protein